MLRIFVFLSFCSLLNFSGAIFAGENRQRLLESEAQTVFATYLQTRSQNSKAYDITLQPFEHLTWIIRVHERGLLNPVPTRYTIDQHGMVGELGRDPDTALPQVNNVFKQEYPMSLTTEERLPMIQAFINLHTGAEMAILTQLADIPGYSKAELAPDVAAAIRAPFEVSPDVMLVYTYQRVGGVVSRYRFIFQPDGIFKAAECAILGQRVGDAQYYQ
jgi:hypothetical protein